MSNEQKILIPGPPVPELPVANVERAQQFDRDVLGFEVAWITEDKKIGAAKSRA